MTSNTSGACTGIVGCRQLARLPRPIPDAGHELARSSRRMQRHAPAVARHDMPRSGHAAHFHLQALDRRIHVSRRAAAPRLFPDHVPRLERLPQLHMHAASRDRAVQREAELEVRREPLGLQRRSRHVAGRPARRRNPAATKCGSMKRSCSSVPHRTSGRRYGVVQNLAISARSSSCCVRLMRACGGISNARNSTSPRRSPLVSGAYSLSMQNSARCVLPVTSTSRFRKIRSTSHGANWPWSGTARIGDFEFVAARRSAPRRRADAGWSAR